MALRLSGSIIMSLKKRVYVQVLKSAENKAISI